MLWLPMSLLLAGSASAQVDQPLKSTAGSTSIVALGSFGAAGQGADDTAVFQAAFNGAASKGQTLSVPAGLYNVRPLYLPANTSVVFGAGVTVQALPGFGQYDHLLNIDDVQNVSLTGTPGQTVFRMNKTEYTSGEYRHCLAILGASNVTVSGIQCNNSGGDGVYISGSVQPYSSTVKILNSGFDNNRRQGMSLVSGKDILVSNCTFTNTNGTLPSDGIDIEPNGVADVLQNVDIESSSVTGNDGDGLAMSIVQMNVTSVPVSIKVANLQSGRNKKSGFFAQDGAEQKTPAVTGTILISNSTSTQNGLYGAVASFWDSNGASLIFQNLTVTNVNSSRSTIDNAAIAVKRGGGAVYPMGNVHFLGTSIIDTAGYLDVYFTVYDWSHIGIAQLQLMDFGSLSGAKAATGLFNGSPAPSININ